MAISKATTTKYIKKMVTPTSLVIRPQGSTIGGNVFIMDSVAPNSLVIYDGLDMRVLSKADKRTAVDFQI